VKNEQINEFRTWLEERIKINHSVGHNQNIIPIARTFRLGGASAFKMALEEFNRVFTSEDQNEGA